jgi:hypothetical protein
MVFELFWLKRNEKNPSIVKINFMENYNKFESSKLIFIVVYVADFYEFFFEKMNFVEFILENENFPPIFQYILKSF